MIEPCLFKSATGYGEQPIISKSLAKQLDCAISLDPRRSSSGIEMHPFKGYSYSSADLTRIHAALNMVHGLAGFAEMEEVEIFVHAKLSGAAKKGVSEPSKEVAGDASKAVTATGDTNRQDSSRFAERYEGGWLSDIVLTIGKSVKLEANDYAILVAHVVELLQPYTERRMKNDNPKEPASLMMPDLKPAAVVSFASAVRIPEPRLA
jgi:hypothetical protein